MSLTLSRMPSCHIRRVSGSLRQRLTRLLTGAMRPRRQALSWWCAGGAGVNAVPRGFCVGWRRATPSSVTPCKPTACHSWLPRWPWRGRPSGQARSVEAAWSGRTQAHEAPGGRDAAQVLQPRPRVLAALTRLLCRRVWGARQGALGAVMTQRGAAAGGAAWSTADAAAAKDNSAAAAPRGWRQAAPLRHGASPQGRKAFRTTGSKPCIHGGAGDGRRPPKRPWSRGRGGGLRETSIPRRRSAGVGRGQGA